MTAAPAFVPRRMKAAAASTYVGESLTKFHAGVKAGKWPNGLHDGGNVYWYREDLDERLDRMKPSGASNSWESFLNGAA